MSSTAFDQAAGLRELFAATPAAATSVTGPLPRVLALISPGRPALTLPLAQACSRQLRQLQLRHAWVDELDFDLREEWPMPCPVRFDLGQALAGHVPLSSALRAFDDTLAWYALARRHSPAVQPSPAHPLSLAQRLADSGLAFDWVVVSAQHDRLEAPPWRLYGEVAIPVMACEATDSALTQALEWVHQTLGQQDGLDLANAAWLLYGSAAGVADDIRQRLEKSCSALLGRPPAVIEQAPWQPGQRLGSLLAPWQEPAARLVRKLCLT